MNDYIDDTVEAASLAITSNQTAPRMFECTLSSPLGSLVKSIEMRSEEDGPPTVGQLTYYLASRLQLVEDCEDFLEWADETGNDAADQKALDAYRKLVTELDQFKTVLGTDNFQSLMTALAIDQAISRARPR
ncbi:MAG: hypothetical protein HKN43_05770 [Rhodothermales bacterium]|nr:hypothetical protein [Rhodothermales bacterium]